MVALVLIRIQQNLGQQDTAMSTQRDHLTSETFNMTRTHHSLGIIGEDLRSSRYRDQLTEGGSETHMI